MRLLFVAVTTVALFCGWVRWGILQVRAEQEALAEIRSMVRDSYVGRPPDASNPFLDDTPLTHKAVIAFVEPVGVEWIHRLAETQGIDLNRVTFLYLSGSKFTDEVIPLLRQVKHLKKLRLDRTRVSDNGAEALALELQDCDILR